MLPLPAEGITLEEKQVTTRIIFPIPIARFGLYFR